LQIEVCRNRPSWGSECSYRLQLIGSCRADAGSFRVAGPAGPLTCFFGTATSSIRSRSFQQASRVTAAEGCHPMKFRKECALIVRPLLPAIIDNLNALSSILVVGRMASLYSVRSQKMCTN
jgi:hypothetical protein